MTPLIELSGLWHDFPYVLLLYSLPCNRGISKYVILLLSVAFFTSSFQVFLASPLRFLPFCVAQPSQLILLYSCLYRYHIQLFSIQFYTLLFFLIEISFHYLSTPMYDFLLLPWYASISMLSRNWFDCFSHFRVFRCLFFL